MPLIELSDVRRVVRALMPLSALPLLWKRGDDKAIAENLASILIKVCDADFVYIFASNHPNVLELAYGPKGRVPVGLIPAIRKSVGGLSVGRPIPMRSEVSGDHVTVLSTQLRFADDATLVVASKRADYPTPVDRLILRVAANLAMSAMERERHFAVARHLTTLVNQSSNFIGVANLQGMPLFVNPAGLKLVGLTSEQEARALHVFDFLDSGDRNRAQYEAWPEVMSKGRWSGQLSFLNAMTGVATPLTVECIRIDDSSGEPDAIGTISIDLSRWTDLGWTPSVSPATAKARPIVEAVALIASLSERESQVLGALIAGHSHKVIGHDLGISVRTVEVHRSRMMRRLGVRTLGEAITLAVISGAVT